MAEIIVTPAVTSRYLPKGMAAVSVYNYNGAEGMTLAQAISAMVFRRAAQLEFASVACMNMLTATSGALEQLTAYAKDVINGTNWDAAKTYLVNQCNVDASSLPANIDTYNNKMQAYEAIETKLKEYNSISDRYAIELQTSVTRRDSFYAMTVNMTMHLGKSGLAAADAMRK